MLYIMILRFLTVLSTNFVRCLFIGLPYIALGTTDGVEREYVGHFDDGVSHAIHIPNGFPFGNFIHSSVYVSTESLN